MEILIRQAVAGDCTAVVELEKKVWGGVDVPSITPELFYAWLKAYPESFFVATESGRVCGYAYQELVNFDPSAMGSPAWQEFLNSRYLECHHVPNGNAVIGISIVAYPPDKGIGKLLLRASEEFFFRTKKNWWLTFSRISGFRAFRDCARNSGCTETDRQLAIYYAVRNMDLAGKKSGPFKNVIVPSTIPNIVDRDPVMGRFIGLAGMLPYDIVVSGFEDPQSCNLAALMVLKI